MSPTNESVRNRESVASYSSISDCRSRCNTGPIGCALRTMMPVPSASGNATTYGIRSCNSLMALSYKSCESIGSRVCIGMKEISEI